MARLQIEVPDDLMKSLRYLKIDSSITLSDMIVPLIKDYVAKQNAKEKNNGI